MPPPIPSLRPPAQVPMMIPQQQPPQVRAPPPPTQPVPLAGIAVGGAPINLNAPPPAIPGQVPIGGQYDYCFTLNTFCMGVSKLENSSVYENFLLSSLLLVH